MRCRNSSGAPNMEMFGASGKQAAPRRVRIPFLIAPRGARSKTSISITVPRNRDVPSASRISSSLGVSFLPNPWTHDESALLLGELSLAGEMEAES